MAQSCFVLKLLEELWFFGNVLRRSKQACSETMPAESGSAGGTESGEQTDSFVAAGNKSVEEENRSMDSIYEIISSSHGTQGLMDSSSVSKDDTRPTSLNSPKTMRSCNSIDSCQSSSSSSPSPSTSNKTAGFDSSMTIRHRPPRDSKPAMTNKYPTASESRWQRTYLQKKWKSLTELESEELQGFKDLGFVFDKGVSSSLRKVIPGLRDAQTASKNETCGRIQRPYLSESWLVQQPSSPTIRWTDKRSAEDIKVQLKCWARTVACNARDVC